VPFSAGFAAFTEKVTHKFLPHLNTKRSELMDFCGLLKENSVCKLVGLVGLKLGSPRVSVKESPSLFMQ